MKRLSLLAVSIFFFASGAFAATPAADLTVRTSKPVIASIPRGAQRVQLLTITLEASCTADVTVSEITLHHAGLGDPEDITALYALQNSTRLSRTTRFSGNERVATVGLRSLHVPACQKISLQIAADFSSAAQNGGEHGVELSSFADIESTATTQTVKQEHASPTTVRTSPANIGTITVTYPRVHTSVKYGSNRTVGKIKLEADAVSDHAITSITLTNDGKARDKDLQNLRLTSSSGEELTATLVQLNGDLAVFVFTQPLILSKNQSRVLEVKADVRAASKKTIRFTVDEPSDIVSTIAKQRGQRFQ